MRRIHYRQNILKPNFQLVSMIVFLLLLYSCFDKEVYVDLTEKQREMILLYELDDTFTLYNENDTVSFTVTQIEEDYQYASSQINLNDYYGEKIMVDFENINDSNIKGFILGYRGIRNFTYNIDIRISDKFYDFSFQDNTSSINDFNEFNEKRINNYNYRNVYSIIRGGDSKIFFNSEYGILKIIDYRENIQYFILRD